MSISMNKTVIRWFHGIENSDHMVMEHMGRDIGLVEVV